jgi:predicted ATPase
MAAMRFRFADCLLDAERFELHRGGRPIAVEPKVFELLLYLVRNHERAITKQELLDAVWPDTATTESSLTRAVSLARTAVGERGTEARVIRTVRGRGYRIDVVVTLEDADTAGEPAPETGFVCRERELAAALAALDAAMAGRGGLLLLAGEPGIGKTRLAQELAERARARGAETLWGRCQEGEEGRAYWPFEQVLRAALARFDANLAHDALGERAAELAELVPELREWLPELPAPSRDPDRARARLFDAVATLLARRAAASPLLLLLDDVDCADGPSLRLLRFLAPRLAELRMLIVCSYRAPPPDPLADTLAQLARFHPPDRKLLLRGLQRGCVERFVAHQLGREPAPALVAACHERSGGNPLFLLELLHWLAGRDGEPLAALEGFAHALPEGIRHVIRSRLARLSELCHRVLECASVLGREFSAELVARVAGLSGAELLALLEEAEAAHAVEPLRDSPGRFRFAHPLIGETLYEELGSAARARLHSRVGEALEERYRPRPFAKSDLEIPIRAAHLAELARHFYSALPLGDPAKALDYCERAGTHALSVLAFDEAEGHFVRALHVLDATAPADAERRKRLSALRADAHERTG